MAQGTPPANGQDNQSNVDSDKAIDDATKKLEKAILKATLAQLRSAEKIVPAKAFQNAVQGLPKQ